MRIGPCYEIDVRVERRMRAVKKSGGHQDNYLKVLPYPPSSSSPMLPL